MTQHDTATVIRIWRTGLQPERTGDYERFAATVSAPMFREQPGFVAAYFGRDDRQAAVITLWRDQASVDALERSDGYLRTVRQLERSGVLANGQSVETHWLHGQAAGPV